ncbi:predicted protein [Chaetomium globosum CBS 148.51]|uniref:Uncharacterized protein n=1 Tax=Chaetomium globosum (strain ATCC 6205 / CBS 148.51 / DSM 1962 / NBRC 6347 / NRRL 1970) TaxID=306901 RepID=Q2GR07_CHAGB|nr:uncharacterized protein CHGG_09597 [Chaetomium globosum CBS 148.51]EAQ83193.1 predicted protein [Chaetomium globosum CBS 148.51]
MLRDSTITGFQGLLFAHVGSSPIPSCICTQLKREQTTRQARGKQLSTNEGKHGHIGPPGSGLPVHISCTLTRIASDWRASSVVPPARRRLRLVASCSASLGLWQRPTRMLCHQSCSAPGFSRELWLLGRHWQWHWVRGRPVGHVGKLAGPAPLQPDLSSQTCTVGAARCSAQRMNEALIVWGACVPNARSSHHLEDRACLIVPVIGIPPRRNVLMLT